MIASNTPEGFSLAMWLAMPRFTGTKREINKMAKM
jgi:hypothetical protein